MNVLERGEVARAWGKQMASELADRHGLKLPDGLIEKMDRRLVA